MKFGIQVNGGVLDLFPGTVVSYELRNQIFSGTSSDVLPGSYQTPLTVPLTSNNKMRLNNPQLRNNADSMMTDEPATVDALGSIGRNGLLSVTSANEREARVQTVFNPFKKLKNIKLTELDLGGERIIGADSDAARAHAKDTAFNNLNYDYIFFPIQNAAFLNDIPATGGNARFWQNYWDGAAQEFPENPDAPIAMPFVKVEYLLERIFADTGFQFVNGWQTDFELRRMVIYNNYSICNADGTWKPYINLINHVPDIPVTEFLKAFMSNFALGLFVDYDAFKIELLPIRDLIKRSAKHDWSDKLIRYSNIERNKFNAPDAYRYADISDEFLNTVAHEQRPTDFTTVDNYGDLPQPPPATPENYYIKSLNQYVEWRQPNALFLFGGGENLFYDLGIAPEYNTETEFQVKCVPIANIFLAYNPYRLHFFKFNNLNLDAMREFPIIGVSGKVPDVQGNESASMPFRYTIYRGLALDQNSNQYPYASCFPYVNQTLIENYSLTWTGERGIYEQWYRRWHEMLRYGKPVSCELKLTQSDLNRFSLKDKVRIDNIDYFIKSMKVSFDSSGLLPVKCELISVI